MYADTITQSMRLAIDETNRRRAKQVVYNAAHGIQPKGVSKRIKDIIDGVYDPRGTQRELKAAEAQSGYGRLSETDLAKEIRRVEREMLEHARNLEFEQAARLRDELRILKDRLFGTATASLAGEAEPAAATAPRMPRMKRRAGGRR
jgi:excinuclease ABC subunit B